MTEEPPWWRSAVGYQVWPRSFADGDGDGIGDLAGLRSRLDHLQDLGIGVLWLSPVYPSPQDDNGYDISDYCAIDPVLGTLAEFDGLLHDVHERGMRLIMDLVVNHTSDEHPWFARSRSSRDDPQRDWYWWRPPRPGLQAGAPGAEPTNWASFFSGPAWELDPGTGEYYLHLFSRKQPDLNWENPQVRLAVHEVMRWWLDRGVDGFRMDVINLVSKEPALPDGRVPEGSDHGDGFPYVAGGPRLHEYLQEMHRAVLTGRDRVLLTVGEMPGVTVEQARLHTDPACGEVDMVFQFEHVQVDQGASKWDVRPLDLRALKRSLGRWQEGLEEVGWNSLYWQNHDQPRVVSRFGDDGVHRVDAAKMLATVLHLHRGTPFVYQGEELGMANYPFRSIADFQDLESRNHHAAAVARGQSEAEVLRSLRAMSRDNARTPMQWDAGPAAGFTSGRPWRPVHPDHVQVNVAVQREDPESVLAHYRKLIRLRKDEPTVVDGRFVMLLPDDERLYGFLRRGPQAELLVLGNFSGDTVPAPVPDAAGWAACEVVVGRARAGSSHDPILLGPWEGRVYRRPARSG